MSDAEWLRQYRQEKNEAHGVRAKSDPVAPNTGSVERDEKILAGRAEHEQLLEDIALVRAMDDENPHKPNAITRVRGRMADFNQKAALSPDYWTDGELEGFRKQED